MGKVLYDQAFIKELQEFAKGKTTKQLAKYLEEKTSRKFKMPTVYSFIRKYNLEINRFESYSDDIVENIRILAKRLNPEQLREYFNSTYNKNLTMQGFYQFLFKNKIKAKRKSRILVPPTNPIKTELESSSILDQNEDNLKQDNKSEFPQKKSINKIFTYQFWSAEEKKYIEEVFEKKKNLSISSLRRELFSKFGVLRTKESIKNYLIRFEKTFLNRFNSDLRVDFYHIKGFVEDYGIDYKRLQKILKENNIKIYSRGRFKMIHIDDLEKVEKLIKEFKQMTYSVKKKEGYISGIEFCNKFYIGQNTLSKYIKEGIIKVERNTKGFLISPQEVKKYEERIQDLDKNYYGYMYIVNNLGISPNNVPTFAVNNNIRTKKLGFIMYYLKEDVDKIVDKKREIEKNYIDQSEAAKRLNMTYETFRKAKKRKFNLDTEYFLGKAYVRLEDVERLKVELKK